MPKKPKKLDICGFCSSRAFLAFLFAAYFGMMPLVCVWAPRAMGSVPVVLGILAWVFVRDAGFRAVLSPSAIFILCAFPVLGFVSALWSPRPELVLDRALKMLLFAVSAFGLLGCAQLLPAHLRRRALQSLPLAVAMAALLVLFEYASNFSIHRWLHDLTYGAKVKTVIFNRVTVICALWLWPAWVLLSREKGGRYGWYLALTLLAVALGVGSSQSAILGLVVGITVWVFLGYEPWRIWATRVGFVVAGCIVLFFPLIARGLYHWQPDFLAQWDTASAGQRLAIWNAVADVIFQFPLLGHGLEATRMLEGDLTRHVVGYDWGSIFHPHNFALQLWIDFGFLGVSVFLTMLYVVYRRVVQADALTARGLVAFIATALSIGFVGYGMWQGWWLGALISTALAFALLQPSPGGYQFFATIFKRLSSKIFPRVWKLYFSSTPRRPF